MFVGLSGTAKMYLMITDSVFITFLDNSNRYSIFAYPHFLDTGKNLLI
jgi:hypothetical protein